MIYDFIVLGAGASGLFFAANRGTDFSSGSSASSVSLGSSALSGASDLSNISELSGFPELSKSGRVLLLEKQNRAGRKLLLSGGGKCNITNLRLGPENYLCANPRFCAPALAAFTPEHLLAFLREHGIGLEEREYGQIFCRSGAEQVRDLLLRLALKRGAELRLGQSVQAVRSLEQSWSWEARNQASPSKPGTLVPSDNPACGFRTLVASQGTDTPGNPPLASGPAQPALYGEYDQHGQAAPTSIADLEAGARFEVVSNGKRLLAANLLLASGGKAWPRSGASSFGYELALAAGHSLIAPRPALTPLKMPADWPLHGLQGLNLLVETSVLAVPGSQLGLHSGQQRGSQDGAHSGQQIGPHKERQSAPADNKRSKTQYSAPTFKLPLLFTHSGLSGPACLQISSYLGAGDLLQVNFLPNENFASLLDSKENSRLGLLGLARRVLPERLAEALLRGAGLSESMPRKVAELGRAVRTQAARAVHEHRVKPEPADFSQAESTLGGIDTAQVHAKTMQSRLVPGLYFSGEVLDVCGQLGGYNLHWAWASAALVSKHG